MTGFGNYSHAYDTRLHQQPWYRKGAAGPDPLALFTQKTNLEYRKQAENIRDMRFARSNELDIDTAVRRLREKQISADVYSNPATAQGIYSRKKMRLSRSGGPLAGKPGVYEAAETRNERRKQRRGQQRKEEEERQEPQARRNLFGRGTPAGSKRTPAGSGSEAVRLSRQSGGGVRGSIRKLRASDDVHRHISPIAGMSESAVSPHTPPGGSASAQSSSTKRYALSPMSAADALLKFGRDSGTKVSSKLGLGKGKVTPASKSGAVKGGPPIPRDRDFSRVTPSNITDTRRRRLPLVNAN